MAIYNYTFSPYEKLAAARLNALVSAVNSHNHDGGSGGAQISYSNLTGLASVANIPGGLVVLNGSGQLPALDGSNLTNLNVTAIPTGAILPYGGQTAPTGYLMCDGSAVSRTTYAALFAVVGSSFGMGDGITTFNVPDYRDRFPFGAENRAVPGSKNTPPGTLSGTGNSVMYSIQSDWYVGTASSGPRISYNIIPPYLGASFIIKT